MKVAAERFFSIFCGRSKEQGFFLAELQVSVAVLAIVVAVLYGDFCQLLQGWQKMFIDMQLRDAGRYMCAILEKDLCYEGKLITLGTDLRGNTKLTCQTGHAGKTYTYTWESKGLYKTTKTTKTTGKNPLFAPDCQVVEWQVEKFNDCFLKLNFVLEKQKRQQKVEQLFHCFNAKVVYE